MNDALPWENRRALDDLQQSAKTWQCVHGISFAIDPKGRRVLMSASVFCPLVSVHGYAPVNFKPLLVGVINPDGVFIPYSLETLKFFSSSDDSAVCQACGLAVSLVGSLLDCIISSGWPGLFAASLKEC